MNRASKSFLIVTWVLMGLVKTSGKMNPGSGAVGSSDVPSAVGSGTVSNGSGAVNPVTQPEGTHATTKPEGTHATTKPEDTTHPQNTQGTPIRGSYIGNWTLSATVKDDSKYPPKLYRPGMCTHVFYAFATIGANYELEPHLENSPNEELLYKDVVGMKEIQKDLKVILSFGGWGISQDKDESNPMGRGMKIREMLVSQENRSRFISSAISLLRKHRFDGFDFDYEPSFWKLSPFEQEECSKGLSSFMKELKEAVVNESAVNEAGEKEEAAVNESAQNQAAETEPAQKETLKNKPAQKERERLILTAAVYANANPFYDVKQISETFDFVNVMTFDFIYDRPDATVLNSPLWSPSDKNDEEEEEESDRSNDNKKESDRSSSSSVEKSVNAWVSKGLPKNKIVVGFPAYGRGKTLLETDLTGVGAPVDQNKPMDPLVPGGATDGSASYHEIRGLIETAPGVVVYRDRVSSSPYLVHGRTWLSYEDETSFKIRALWAIEQGLAGGFVWNMAHDEMSERNGDGPFPLHFAIAGIFKGSAGRSEFRDNLRAIDSSSEDDTSDSDSINYD